MSDLETKLRERAKELLAGDKVDMVLGYRAGTLPLQARPCFVRRPEEVDQLVWNSGCGGNLATYLPLLVREASNAKDAPPPRMAIVAKGCDARSVTGLIRERQIPAEDVCVIAVPCTGMVDLRKVRAAAGDTDIAEGEDGENGNLRVLTTGDDNIEIDREDVLAAACLACTHPVAPQADIRIDGPSRPAASPSFENVAAFAARPPAERWEHFIEEISRCIRCYACRQACPNCFCKTCFAEQTKPSWMGAGNSLENLVFFHLGRAFHQAGRCVGCDACARACPMGIDLRLLNEKTYMDVAEMFGCVPGLSVEDAPALRAFSTEDSDDFITDPEAN